MKRFGAWLKEQFDLHEGGNVKIGDHTAEAIDLTKHKRSEMSAHVHDFLHSVHQHVHDNGGGHLFGKNAAALHKGTAFAGSTKEFMNKKTSDRTFTHTYGKKKVGDIDAMVDHSHMKKGGHLEKALAPGTKHGKFTVVGHKRIGTQIHALIKHHDTGKTHQVDFESSTYHGDHPSEWNQLSTNSHKEDMKSGVKGVHHKLLLNAAVKGHKTITGSLKGKEGKYPTHTFSVSHGMRQAHRLSKSGGLEKVESKHKPTYETDPKEIAHKVFSHKNAEIHSFHGVVRSIKKHMTPEQQKRTLDHYKENLSRTDPNSSETKKSLTILKHHFPEHF